MSERCALAWRKVRFRGAIAILLGGVASGACRDPGSGSEAAAPPSRQPGGGPNASPELTISLARPAFRVGEPIELRWRLTNRSASPITVWSCGFWPNHRLRVATAVGADVPLTKLGRERRDDFGRPSRKKNVPIVLQPGEQASGAIVPGLEALRELVPGRYTVEIEYDDPSGPTPLKLRSNRLRFAISG